MLKTNDPLVLIVTAEDSHNKEAIPEQLLREYPRR
jgi:hypothetical protein